MKNDKMRYEVPVGGLSRAAASILQRQRAVVGWVHSCYGRVINIRTPTGRLLTLQGRGRLKGPLAISICGDMERLVSLASTGALVIRDFPGTVATPAALKLVLDDAMVWEGGISPVPSVTGAEIYTIADRLETWMVEAVSGRGLAVLLPVLSGGGNDLSPLDRKVLDAFSPFFLGDRLSTESLFEGACRVLGVGGGLTPSGDDLLVGLMAALHVTGQVDMLLPTPIRYRFLEKVKTETSDLSGEFLRCALEGDFAESIGLLVRSLFGQRPEAWSLHAASLATMGHSSGIDAMVGIVLGCRLMARFMGHTDAQRFVGNGFRLPIEMLRQG